MWGVYGYSQFSCEVAAFMEGLSSLRLPFRERNHNGFTGDDQIEEFCPVVVSGLRDKGEAIRRAYNSVGVPCIVIDYGYLKRVSGISTMQSGHWQVGVDRLGWVPEFECPADRFDRLGIDLKERGAGDKIYVCGQHGGDPSHGLSRDQIVRWAMDVIDGLRGAGREIVWRPHPDTQIEIGGVQNSTGPIDWLDVHCIVTINSNVGNDALINGVPVIAYGDAPYNDLANDSYSDNLFFPPKDVRRRYLQRLAYAQWTLDEIKAGRPQRWLIENDLTKRKPR